MRTMKPVSMRKGAKGYEIVWTGIGEDRVREVLASDEKHHGGRGGGSGKGSREKREEATVAPEHVLYTPSEAQPEPRWEEGQAEEDRPDAEE